MLSPEDAGRAISDMDKIGDDDFRLHFVDDVLKKYIMEFKECECVVQSAKGGMISFV